MRLPLPLLDEIVGRVGARVLGAGFVQSWGTGGGDWDSVVWMVDIHITTELDSWPVHFLSIRSLRQLFSSFEPQSICGMEIIFVLNS